VIINPFGQILRKVLLGSLFYPMAALKVSFCVYKASYGNILTRDNFKKGKIMANRCFVCKGGSKLVDHVQLHYQFGGALWELAFSWLGISQVALIPQGTI